MELSAQKREIKGSKVKALRAKGLIPAVIFSRKSSKGKAEIDNIECSRKDFEKVFSEVGYSALIDIAIGSVKRPVLIKEVQVEPLNLDPIHVSFYEVDMSQPIEAQIPVILVNEENCAPVVAKEGILLKVLDEVHVRCLPQYIPQNFEVDVSVLLKVEDSLTVKDAIKVNPEHIEILTDQEEVLVKVDYAEQLETVEETQASVDQVEVITEAKEGEEGEKEGAEEETDKAVEKDKKTKPV